MSNTINFIDEPSAEDTSINRLVINYLKLRRYIGYLGMTLPVILVIGVAILNPNTRLIQVSISDYYYTEVRNVFVGVLVAVSAFLHSYKGYKKLDNLLTSLAALFALGIAFIPTTSVNELQNTLHLISAGAFFIILSYLSYFLFTRTNQDKPGKKKHQRNQIYRICAIIMVVCILLVPSLSALLGNAYYQMNLTFWLETIALLAFGFSWLTKGEAILPDDFNTGVNSM
ncbi:MAG: hypothetical protein ACNS62_14480 [Candidatus Cyclobacteriaceae bacterium M3_2C_046]